MLFCFFDDIFYEFNDFNMMITRNFSEIHKYNANFINFQYDFDFEFPWQHNDYYINKSINLIL